MISQVHINLKIYPIAMFDQRPVIPCTLAELVDATLMECSCTLAALRCATLLARVGRGGIIASMYACGTS